MTRRKRPTPLPSDYVTKMSKCDKTTVSRAHPCMRTSERFIVEERSSLVFQMLSRSVQHGWNAEKSTSGWMQYWQFFVGTLWVIRLNKCAVAAGWWRNHAASVKRANPWQWIDKAYNCRRLAPLIDQLSHVVPHDLKKERASSWKNL